MSWCLVKYNEEMKAWHLISPKYYSNISEAKDDRDKLSGIVQVIHTSWIDCLDVWPTPKEMEEMYETVG